MCDDNITIRNTSVNASVKGQTFFVSKKSVKIKSSRKNGLLLFPAGD